MEHIEPYLLPKRFGDGQKLMSVTTLDSRPQYYVVMADSRWDESNWSNDETFGEHSEEVAEALEEWFGRVPTEYEVEYAEDGTLIYRDDDGVIPPDMFEWPAFDDRTGGMIWREIWPEYHGYGVWR